MMSSCWSPFLASLAFILSQKAHDGKMEPSGWAKDGKWAVDEEGGLGKGV